jgi:RNA polymerase sigma-70 factor (ECF subfamily)
LKLFVGLGEQWLSGNVFPFKAMELAIEARSLRGPVFDGASEASLVERCRNQDVEAFGRLVDAYQHRIFGFVKRMVPLGEDAADVTQEVFIRAFQSISKFDGRCSIRTWLFRIAHNLCVDRSRRFRKHPQELSLFGENDEELNVSDDRWEPEQWIMTAELAERIDEAIASMSEKLRTVLLLHDREDVGYEEIAQMLDIPVGTVKSRLFLARSFLQSRLKQYVEADAQ